MCIVFKPAFCGAVWSILLHLGEIALLHKAKGGAELVLLIYLIAQGMCWGHLAGKGLHTVFFPWISSDWEGVGYNQGFSQSSSEMRRLNVKGWLLALRVSVQP